MMESESRETGENKSRETGESESRETGESESTESFQTAPKNVPTKLWEKFKLLEKRTEEVTRKSTNKRKQKIKDEVLLKVKSEIADEEGVSILHKYDVKIDQTSGKSSSQATQEQDVATPSVSTETRWTEVRDLMDVNKHLHTGLTTYTNRSLDVSDGSLDDRLETAIKAGDVEEAERLSDHMTCRQFGKKVTEAVEAREYLKRKKIEENSIKQKKKKKLHWGFQEKERWETKGNM